MIDDVFGARPSTKPEVLVDTLKDEEVIEDSDPIEALLFSGPTSSELSDCVVVEKQFGKKENTEGKKKGKKDQQKKSV